MNKKENKAFKKEQEIELKTNKGIIAWWEKITNNSKLSYFILIALLIVTLIVVFVVLATTNII